MKLVSIYLHSTKYFVLLSKLLCLRMSVVTILLCIVAGVILFMLFMALLGWALDLYADSQRPPYVPPKEWAPTKTLQHTGIQLFHLPFTPVLDEVIYLENEYDEEANLFIQENIKMITEKMKAKGYRFIYLPSLKFSAEKLRSAVEYHYPDGISPDVLADIEAHTNQGMKSCFLLDYMVKSRNRKNISSTFIWYNGCRDTFGVPTFIYDGIRFVGTEALEDPELLMDEVCEELGNCNDWLGGLCCKRRIEGPEGNFSAESKQMLEEIRERLEKIRLNGVSEAIIAEYIRPKVKLSALRITKELRLFLTDYQDKEVLMEPLNKAVFILFLRHPEGIVFKELPDYRRELGIIYNAIQKRNNDIDILMAREAYMPMLNDSIRSVTDPLKNSINEKCARIREAFLILMPEVVASNYFVTGTRGMEKCVKLDRSLVTWELNDKEGGEK